MFNKALKDSTMFNAALKAAARADAQTNLKHKIGDHVHLHQDYAHETAVIIREMTSMLGTHLWQVQVNDSDSQPIFYDHELTLRFQGPFSDSLSFGMRAALARHPLEFVDTFTWITQCVARDEQELEQIIERYQAVYWKECPEIAADACRRAFRGNRILMPRQYGYACPIAFECQPAHLYVSFEEYRDAVAAVAPDWNKGWCPPDFEGKVTAEQVKATTNPIDLYKLFPFPEDEL